MSEKRGIIVAITGASGAVYGIRLLEVLKEIPEIEVHLIVSRWAEETIRLETDYSVDEVKAMAASVHDNKNLAASISSGSFPLEGMIIAPASMKTVAGIASGFSSNLILRAADVALKEGRRLIIVPRETPLSQIHLENLLKISRAGGIVLPSLPGFYTKPRSIADLVDHSVGKILDQFKVEHDLYRRWGGDCD